jgi:hypothetical protein
MCSYRIPFSRWSGTSCFVFPSLLHQPVQLPGESVYRWKILLAIDNIDMLTRISFNLIGIAIGSLGIHAELGQDVV